MVRKPSATFPEITEMHDKGPQRTAMVHCYVKFLQCNAPECSTSILQRFTTSWNIPQCTIVLIHHPDKTSEWIGMWLG